MIRAQETVQSWGPQHLAKAIERLAEEADRAAGAAAKPIYARPSFWINAVSYTHLTLPTN